MHVTLSAVQPKITIFMETFVLGKIHCYRLLHSESAIFDHAATVRIGNSATRLRHVM